jgi:metal-responsive CopG/Arc/MetJ family transcriptional regulator
MKIKTSITLSREVLTAIDQRARQFENRSAFIEAASRAYLKRLTRNEQNVRDLEIIGRQSRQLNAEAADVLSYQVIP